MGKADSPHPNAEGLQLVLLVNNAFHMSSKHELGPSGLPVTFHHLRDCALRNWDLNLNKAPTFLSGENTATQHLSHIQ